MNYHDIQTNDMMNGTGLRVVIWISGCRHYCHECQNPQTWDFNSGILFEINEKEEIFNELKKEYISGVTLTGGDPLYNYGEILPLCKEIKSLFPDKTIWLYTGFIWDDVVKQFPDILNYIDVIVDGRFVKELADVKYQWAGSTNQRVIDVQKSLENKEVMLWKTCM